MNVPVYTLRNQHGYVGIAQTARSQTYIVGFRSKYYATLVRRTLPSRNPKLEILHGTPENVAHEVETGLLGLGIRRSFGGIHISTGAELVVPKNIKAANDNENLFDIVEMDYGTFIMKPFDCRLGVVDAVDLIREDSDSYGFLSNVIHPTEDTEFFRAFLN